MQLGAVQVTKLMDSFHKVESGLKGRQLLIRNRVRDGQLPEGTNYCAATCSKMLGSFLKMYHTRRTVLIRQKTLTQSVAITNVIL